ncbi:Retron-type reverse transcriptase-like protein [Photorhabdus temperata subsp. temperata M1021]|nr:Retron-type reverse transcriptase-like protein [Photorhabdus temperata subsp. temperata M1021]
METVIERSNMMLAYQRVVENKGAAGVDNLSIQAETVAEKTLGKCQKGINGRRISPPSDT